MTASLKLNEIRSAIKLGNFIRRDRVEAWGNILERWPRKFCSETFHNGYENLIQMPKYQVQML
jgi:hypothetical protein